MGLVKGLIIGLVRLWIGWDVGMGRIGLHQIGMVMYYLSDHFCRFEIHLN